MITDVTIRCNVCHEVYKVSFELLKKKTSENAGFFPCRKCGSQATDWQFGSTTENNR